MGTLEIKSAVGMSRLEFVGPGPIIDVSLIAPDLQVTTWINEESDYPAVFPAQRVKTFFVDLAGRWMDDASSIAYECPDGRLRMRCEWDSRGRFHLRINLRGIVVDQMPIWTLETGMELETSMLPGLAATAADAL